MPAERAVSPPDAEWASAGAVVPRSTPMDPDGPGWTPDGPGWTRMDPGWTRWPTESVTPGPLRRYRGGGGGYSAGSGRVQR
jgi:hypothetical protein